MQFLQPSEYPEDFFYHRTSAEIYRPYLDSHSSLETFDIGHPPQYAWRKKLFGNVYISRYERTDIEPDITKLKREGMKHGMITWVPYSRTDIPKGWKRLWLTDHFQETSLNIIDTNYRNRWNDRARRAVKKFEKSGVVIRAVDPEIFVEAFRATKVKHWYKSDYIRNYKRIRSFAPDQVRQWLAYDGDQPIAGLACIDYLGDHSVHFVAFTSKTAYRSQAGTGLIDTWFRESLEKGVKYITFDQLRNKHGPSDQKGYTAFKENFIEYRLSFPKAYFRIF